MNEYKSEIRDGMRIEWDVPIRMDDGVVLRADIPRHVGTASREHGDGDLLQLGGAIPVVPVVEGASQQLGC